MFYLFSIMILYKVVSPYLQGEELAWLKEATRAI